MNTNYLNAGYQIKGSWLIYKHKHFISWTVYLFCTINRCTKTKGTLCTPVWIRHNQLRWVTKWLIIYKQRSLINNSFLYPEWVGRLCIATRLWNGRPKIRGYISGGVEFLFANAPRLNLRPTPMGTGRFFPGVKRQRCAADHSSEVKNEWNYTSIPLYDLPVLVLN
jgi:hypothetical protein